MTSLYIKVKIIESITTADISVDEIMCKFRKQIQKCMRKKILFFYLNANYSLFDFIICTTTCLRHYTETQTKSECY